jgi:hypothetical protein
MAILHPKMFKKVVSGQGSVVEAFLDNGHAFSSTFPFGECPLNVQEKTKMGKWVHVAHLSWHKSPASLRPFCRHWVCRQVSDAI